MAALEVATASEPGEGDDQLARAVAEGLTNTNLLPSATIYNAPGDGGAKGLAEFAAGSRPRSDMLIVSLDMLGQITKRNAQGGLDRCEPLACLTGERQPIVVPAASPYKTLADLTSAIRADSSKVHWAGRSLGGSDHQLVLMLTKAVGGDPKAISYQAGDERTDVAVKLLKDEVAVATGDLWDLIQQIRGGTLRALGLSSPERAPGVPIPTFREQGLNLELVNWRGVVARDKMDRALIARFGGALHRLEQVAGWRQLLVQRFWIDLYKPGPDFATMLASERRRIADLLKDSG